ncbi:MAG TPA: cytochrome c [Gaiellaceae bacterium]|nr:cytochrome c [Gaiellaceae bacterium]
MRTASPSVVASRIVLALMVLALGVGLAACGGDDDTDATTTAEETTTEETTTTEDTTTTTEAAAGREIFVANCGSCHALSDAGTSGAVGPSLDGIGLDASAVEAQVRNGGGGMPAFEGQLTDEEIQAVSAYVAGSS